MSRRAVASSEASFAFFVCLLVVVLASALSLNVVVRGMLGVVIEGSIVLFLAGTLLHLFATTALGIFLAIIARSMPQFALLLFMTLLPMQILSGAGGVLRAQTLSSGGVRHHEGMAGIIDLVMQAAPTTHFVEFSQAILFRGAGLEDVWMHLASLAAIGVVKPPFHPQTSCEMPRKVRAIREMIYLP